MGAPSGSFNSAYSGLLRVTFRAQYTTNSGSDFGTGTINLRIRGYVGTGGGRATTVIDINNSSAVIEQNYVGGSGPVAVGTEYIDSSLSGPSSITARPITISCALSKK